MWVERSYVRSGSPNSQLCLGTLNSGKQRQEIHPGALGKGTCHSVLLRSKSCPCVHYITLLCREDLASHKGLLSLSMRWAQNTEKGLVEEQKKQHLSMPPGGRSHLCLSFPVCPNPCAAMHCPSSMWQLHCQLTVLQAWVSAHRSPVWQTSLNSQAALCSAAQPHVGQFPRICSQVDKRPADSRRLADPLECSASLKGSCHSDHMLVSLPKHEDMKPFHTVQQLHKSDIRDTQTAAETDTETPMQEQGKDQNGNEDIWWNSSDANG